MSRVSRPRLAAAATALALVALVTGCNADTETGTPTGGDNTTSPETEAASSDPGEAEPTEATEPSEPSDTASESAQQIDIDITGDTVSPSGDSVDVPLGEPLDLVVTADVAGEIHVHSDPEQYLEFQPGEQTFTLTIERPGVVEVERHDPDLLIVQLTVQ